MSENDDIEVDSDVCGLVSFKNSEANALPKATLKFLSLSDLAN